MNDYEQRQLEMLQQVVDTCMPPTPAFKDDHKGVPEGMIPYICCSDLFDRKYNIRIIPEDDFFSEGDEALDKKENGKIIAHYDILEDLVADGWRLD